MTGETVNLPLTADSIFEEACERCGGTIWSDYMRESLEVLLESFKSEANAYPEVVGEFRNHCVSHVVKGMCIIHTLNATPDIEKTKITKPLFIIGMPRTGTTILHYLMGEDPNARPLLGWESYTIPVPPPEPATHKTDPRIEGFRVGIEEFYSKAPEHRATHQVEVEGPEECIGLFANQMHAHIEYAKYNVPGYANWLINRDMKPAYEFYKKQLQCLAYHFHDDRHWVLKAPFHLYFLNFLADVFPDACFIQTHRVMTQVVPSAVSLTHQLRSLHGPSDKKALGAQLLESMSRMAVISMEHRAKLGPDRFLDLPYKEVTKDPTAAVRRIYDRFGYQWSDAFEENIKKRLSVSPKNKHGVHKYTMEEFGLSEAKINEAFKEYNEAYGEYL